MVEQVDPLKVWRTTVAMAARKAAARYKIVEPIDYPIDIRMIFKFKRPPRATFTTPVGREGDVDKLQRNVFDALQDGLLLRNDSRILAVCARKVYASEDEKSGLWISISRSIIW